MRLARVLLLASAPLCAMCAPGVRPKLASLRPDRVSSDQPVVSSIEHRLTRLRGGGVDATKPVSGGALATVVTQLAKEFAGCTKSPAKFFGFVGACCNWFLGLSALYDASSKGPELISLPMTLVLLVYSLLFGRWAGWDVSPANYMLCGSHMFNVVMQANQLRRCIVYKLQTEPGAKKELTVLGTKAAASVALVSALIVNSETIKSAVAPYGPAFLTSAGGPFTIHPWPPVTKLFLSMTSLLELDRPTEKISLTQYAALTLTGFIFSFYGLFVTPINYPLTVVNILLFASSAWHLGRKIKADYFSQSGLAPI
eukprot:CAMPEP_0183350998 /NCGR_PEP_ID=MMETSP0164_2-20130417/22896_1 /TAXON_ID=221442 /ORGANISM="Coccolithus pelagicus ssp braarudi, Strain PLY182g" /LENGTH=311 /DNA_ID=CAMNT_0025523069 /DNA_START=36 /DNA_END=971 /DNA_ORIENTATION=-